ncbi:MAG: hypothetical protein KGH63_02440 [Candidatus Micrarchaeota archaeon]|nr:hypothetical protein [Candidatus Micrarchaeota archaeon]
MRGQSSLEYILLLSALLLILISVYGLSVDMDLRRSLISSQMEGERVASRLGRAIDAVAAAGPGAQYNLSLTTNPNQTIIVSGAEVLAFGPQNRTLAVVHTLGNLTSQNQFTANSNVQVYYNPSTGNITVTPWG